MKKDVSCIDLFLGQITEVPDEGVLNTETPGRQSYEVKVKIPGIAEEIIAVPLTRGEIDEPSVGNLVIVMCLDHKYHSVNFYTKLKENDYIGFRSNGKILDITPDYMILGSDGKDKTYTDEQHIEEPEKSYLKFDDEGNIDLYASQKQTINIENGCELNIKGDNFSINIEKDQTIKVDGECKIEVTGNCELKGKEIKVSGGSKVNIDSPDVSITGASFKVAGMASAGTSGPFCGIPACLFTGAPHLGNQSSGN